MAVDAARAKFLFLEASDLASPAEHAAYLDRECGGEADLRARVEALLAADAGAGAGRTREPVAPGRLAPPTPEIPRGASAFAPESTPATELFTEDADPDGAPTKAAADSKVRRTGTFVAGRVIAGRYTLLEVLGEGGMGTVYRAVQTEPVKRQVALKLIRTGMDSRTVLARFDAERQALALMDHPNIARVYDGGTTAAGQPFFVMDLVIGESITAYCDRRRLPVRRRLELFVAVCQAVQHAHQKGIIHRDLKPGNVLVADVDGRPLPKVIDFGVAKATGFDLTDQTLADTGVIVGTPAYMSPEQADPSSMDIDTRTDVYALGVILYELLAGSPPLEAKQLKRGAILEMLRMVREVDPPRPSTKLSTAGTLPNIAASRDVDPAHLKQAIRGDLDWIVMKALEKDRTRRYATAIGFAADVQRHLAHEPVLAAPPSRAYRLRKSARKHRGAVIAAGLVLLALLGGIAGTTWGLIEARRQERIARGEASAKEQARQAEAERAEGERFATRKALAAAAAEKRAKEAAQVSFAEARQAETEATEQRNRADHEAEVAQQALYYAQMHVAQQTWREHRGLPHMRELLASWLPGDAAPDRRGWEWFYLNSLPYQNLRTLTGGGAGNGPSAVAWHVASKRLAAGTADGVIRVWDVDRERPTLILRAPAPAVPWWGIGWLAWSPDGTRLAAGGKDGTVHVWEAGSGRELIVLRGHNSPIFAAAFSSDGARVAAWGGDGAVRIWDATTGRLTADLAHPGAVSAGAWSPDDTLLATGHQDGSVTISGTHPDAKIATLRGPGDPIYCLAWSPDSTRLATTSANDFAARIWDVASQKSVLGPLRHSHGITALAWEPDGRRLATGSIDQAVKVWDAATGREAATLRGHVDSIVSLSWGPGGHLASGGVDGSVRIWAAIRDQESGTLPAQGVRATAASWSPDGRRLASGGDDGKVRIWDPAARGEVLTLKGHDEGRVIPQFGLIRSLAWSPDGLQLASAGLDGAVKVWEIAGGRERFALPADCGPVWSVAWSPDGAHLAAGSEDGTIRVVEGLGLAPKVRGFKAHRSRVRSLAWSPRGVRLASGGGDGPVKLWDPIRGTESARMQDGQAWILKVAWSPDGTRLAAASADFLVRTWDAETGRKLSTLRGHNDYVDAVAWSPDGTRLASAGLDNSVRVWDSRTGAEAFVLRGDSGMYHDVSWHPDGAQLAAASSDGQVWIWDATRGFERDSTPRALPFIDRQVAAGAARGADLLRYAESYLRAGMPAKALALVRDDPPGLRALAPRIAVAFHALGDRPALDDLLRLHPAAAAAVGDLYAARRDWGRAIAEYGKILAESPDDGNVLDRRALAYAAAEQWDQARADWRRAIVRQPALAQHGFDRLKLEGRWGDAAEFGWKLVDQPPGNSQAWLWLAPVLVLAGDEAAYGAFCDRMAKQFAGTADPVEAERTIKACLLRPDAIDLARLPGAALDAYLGGGAEPAWLRPHAGAARALLAYRGGDAEAALSYATGSQARSPADFLQAVNLAVLAMAQHRLRHPDLARRALDDASGVTGRLAADADRPNDVDTLIAQILLREAAALIDGKPRPRPAAAMAKPKDDPNP